MDSQSHSQPTFAAAVLFTQEELLEQSSLEEAKQPNDIPSLRDSVSIQAYAFDEFSATSSDDHLDSFDGNAVLS